MLYQRLILSRWRQFICLRNYAKQGAVGDVIVSQRCIQRLNEIAKDGENLRVLVDGGGCSGFEYKMQLDKSINDDDIVFNAGRAKIVVDEKSLEFMKGATVDYVEDLMRSSFRVVNNPIAEKGCSCGSSFAIKMD